MEDIINLMMDFLVEDWLENEGDSDFVDYLYAMGIHQHQSHAHPSGERKKREAQCFFSTVRGPTIIRPKYIRRLMTTPRPSGKNKKRKNVVPTQSSRKRRRVSTPPSHLGSYNERKRYCVRVRHRGYPKAMLQYCRPFISPLTKPTINTNPTKVVPSQPPRRKRSPSEPYTLLWSDLERKRYCTGIQQRGGSRGLLRKCEAFLSAFDKLVNNTNREDSQLTRIKRGISPPRPRPTTTGGTHSGLNWRIRQQGNGSPSPERLNRNRFVMRNRNKAGNRPSEDPVIFRHRSSSVSSNTRGPLSSLRRVQSRGGAETFSDITISRWKSMPAPTNPVNSQRLPKPVWYKVPRQKWKQFAGKYPTVAAGISMTSSTESSNSQ